MTGVVGEIVRCDPGFVEGRKIAVDFSMMEDDDYIFYFSVEDDLRFKKRGRYFRWTELNIL